MLSCETLVTACFGWQCEQQQQHLMATAIIFLSATNLLINRRLTISTMLFDEIPTSLISQKWMMLEAFCNLEFNNTSGANDDADERQLGRKRSKDIQSDKKRKLLLLFLSILQLFLWWLSLNHSAAVAVAAWSNSEEIKWIMHVEGGSHFPEPLNRWHIRAGYCMWNSQRWRLFSPELSCRSIHVVARLLFIPTHTCPPFNWSTTKQWSWFSPLFTASSACWRWFQSQEHFVMLLVPLSGIRFTLSLLVVRNSCMQSCIRTNIWYPSSCTLMLLHPLLATSIV